MVVGLLYFYIRTLTENMFAFCYLHLLFQILELKYFKNAINVRI